MIVGGVADRKEDAAAAIRLVTLLDRFRREQCDWRVRAERQHGGGGFRITDIERRMKCVRSLLADDYAFDDFSPGVIVILASSFN